MFLVLPYVLFNNNRSGRYKLIEKMDSLICLLPKKHNLITEEFQSKYHIMNKWGVYKLQCLCLMYDLCNNNLILPFFPVNTINLIHVHITRSNANIHINSTTLLELSNFMYNSILFWNSCPYEYRILSKRDFVYKCKLLQFYYYH